MANKITPLKVGPFSGGINTYGDPTSIADTDCVALNNFDIDLNGTLKGRSPITALSANTTAGKTDQRILGKYTTATGVPYIMIASTGATVNYLIAYNVTLDTYAVVTGGTDVKFTSMVKYINKAWFICDAGPTYGGSGGSWDGTTWTPIPGMAHGVSACIYKERIFVSSGQNSPNPSRINMSGPGATIDTWNLSTDFFDVNNGDGQPIVKLWVYSGSIVVFKTNSTFTFAYDTAPTKGQVQNISSTIGIDSSDSMVDFENIMYVMHDSKMYSITNWLWSQINIKAPFEYVNTHGLNTSRTSTVSLLGNRVVCRYYDSLYIYYIQSKAWSRWTPNTALAPDFWIRSPVKDLTTGIATYFAGNYLTNTSIADPAFIFKFKDTYTATDKEAMVCSFSSKVYDEIAYGSRTRVFNVKSPQTYKRLMWWGVDVLANSSIDANITPITFNTPTMWSDLTSKSITWADSNSHTWAHPLTMIIRPFYDSVDINNASGIRTFIKYVKSVRFREIQFNLSSAVDGSTNTSPFSIFSIIAYIANKEIVDKKVS